MKYCSKCGTSIEDEMKFCPSCGEILVQEKESVKETSKEDMTKQDSKLMAVLAYFGILVLIPCFVCKESKFVRFHVNQGLLVLILEIGYAVCYNILSPILLDISWELYDFVHLISMVSILFLILSVMGILNAVNGKTKELPVIGKIKLIED